MNTPVDMRKYVKFPAPPKTAHEIWCYPGNAWLLACAMAGKYDAQQFNAYRALHFALGDDERYRTALVIALDILASARNIRSRAGFIYSQLAAELASLASEGGSELSQSEVKYSK